jgi:hypothetical protein
VGFVPAVFDALLHIFMLPLLFNGGDGPIVALDQSTAGRALDHNDVVRLRAFVFDLMVRSQLTLVGTLDKGVILSAPGVFRCRRDLAASRMGREQHWSKWSRLTPYWGH